MIKKKWSSRFGRHVFGYDARIGGKRRQRFGFSSEKTAELALSKLRVNAFERGQGVAAPEETRKKITVRQLFERRRVHYQDTPRRRARAHIMELWLESLPTGLLVTELTTARLSDWVDSRLKAVKPQTVFRDLTDICSMLARAGDYFDELKDWQPPRRPHMRVPTGARGRLITRDEARALLTRLRRPRGLDEGARYYAARLDSADLLQIALLTAARRGEILSLRWSDVDFNQATLRVTGTKTERVRVIPCPAALITILRRRATESGRSPLVFPALAGSTMLRANTDQIFREESKALGIPYGRSTIGGWVLHDARHTAITAMLHAGASLESVMAVSGHSARVMALRYAHATQATTRAAVQALEQFGEENPAAFVAATGRD
jgi:integrase